MIRRLLLSLVVLIPAALVVAGLHPATAEARRGDRAKVKNVIVMVPDGCSSSIQTLARWYKGAPLTLDKMVAGSVKTYMKNSIITGSAAAATAFASGYKTTVRFVGVGPRPDDVLSTETVPPEWIQYRPLATVLEGAKVLGKATGLISTSRITHATPAAYGAHVHDRGMDNEIMEHLVYQNIDVVMGGGKRHLLPAPHGRRSDGEDLVQVLLDRGYAFVETREALMNASNRKVWGMFASSHMEAELDRAEFAPTQPSIAEMTRRAIEILAEDDDGFFLMVEGSQVDWAGHANDPVYMVTDMLAFDAAVKVAMDFAQADGETLVIAFPDHNTGAMSIGSGKTSVPYTATAVEDLVAPLQGMRITSYGVARKIGSDKSTSNVRRQIRDWWGLDISEQEAVDILSRHSGGLGLDYAISEVIGANYTVIGWTTHGHTGEDVPLWSFGPASVRPVGLVDNTELAQIVAAAFGFDLLRLNRRLFVDARSVFPNATLDQSDAANPVLIVRNARIPVSKDYIDIGGHEYFLSSIVVHAPLAPSADSWGKVYLPREGVKIIRRCASGSQRRCRW